MFKKALLAGAVLAATSGLAFANGGSFAPPPPHHVHNVYVGVGISRDTGHFNTTSSNYERNDVTGLITNDFRRKFDWSATGVNGELFAGIKWEFQNRYTLATEVFGSLSSMEGKYDLDTNNAVTGANFSSRAKVELQNSVGIALMPGVKLSDSTTLYGRVAWVNSRFKVRDNGARTAPGVAVNVGGLDGQTINYKKRKNGIQLGVGMETMVTQNVGIRGEYDWTYYGKLNVPNREIGSNGITTVSSTQLKPQTDQFKLAAVYHFNAA